MKLCIISNLFKANELSLNTDETNFIAFHPYQRTVPHIDLVIDNHELLKVPFTTCGIVTGENWAGNQNTSYLEILVVFTSLKIYFLRIFFFHCNRLILSHFNYCSFVLASTYPSFNYLFSKSLQWHLSWAKSMRTPQLLYFTTCVWQVFFMYGINKT